MRKPSAGVIGGVVLLLLIGAGAFWWLRPTSPAPTPPAAPRTGRRQLPATPPAPPQGALQVRGRVVDLQGHPVAGIEVSASVGLPGETLTELPCDTDRPGVSLASEDCDSLSAFRWVQELVEAHRGGAFVLSRTTSAQDGTFTLEGLPGGTVTLWALGPRGAGIQEDVVTGTQDVTLELEPSQPISGRAVDEDGAPLANVQVTVLHTATARYFETRTGTDGRFSVGPLPDSDAYGLLAFHPGRLPVWEQELATGPMPEDVVMFAPRRIVGTVVDGEQPVAGATVTEADGDRVATTDAQGRFTFDGLAPGDYTVEAEQGGLQAHEAVKLTEEQREARVTLRLGTSFYVEATVRDAAGNPVANAEVNADLQTDITERYGSGIFQPLGTTEADGRARLGPFKAGTYSFRVEADRMLDLSATRAVAAGGPPLEFVLTPALLVEGHVTDTAGKPLADVSLSLHPPKQKRPEGAPPPVMARMFIMMHPPREAPFTFDATSDAQGHFAIKVAQPLSGTLTVEAEGYLPRRLQVRAPTSGLKLVLDAGATVRGTVTSSRGTPVNEVDVTLVKQDADEAPSDEDSDEAVVIPERNTFAGSTGEDGRFTLQGLPPGTFTVWMRANQGGYERLMPDRVVLRGSETVELALRMDLDGRMGGIVVDTEGRPLANVAVHATAKEDEASGGRSFSPLSTKTDPDGRFVLEPLARDWDYELEAVKPGYAQPRPPAKDTADEDSTERPEDETPEELTERIHQWLEDQEAPKVTARAGNMDVRIVLAFQGRVTGRLARHDGTPITRFTVNDEAVRDPKGAFTVFVDEPGPQHLTFEVPGHALTQRDVDVPAGRDVDLGTVRVDPGRVIKGRVVDDGTGTPLGGVSVSLALPQEDVANAEHASSFADVFTARDGTFQLPAVEARPYVLTVQEAEHASLERTLGPTEDTLELRLPSDTRLEVLVKDEQGQPVTASLTAIAKEEQEMLNIVVSRNGVASFRGLDPGDYLVRFTGNARHFTVLPRMVHVEPRRVTRLELPVTTKGTELKLRWGERGMQGTAFLLPGRVPAPPESSTEAQVTWLHEQALMPDRNNGDGWPHLPPGPYTLLVLREREGRWLSYRQDVTVGTADVQDVEVPTLPW
ncbi:carboxypeptidase regulatory-like domain-containing protein [Corallococcus macrosporus]|uniref:Carboxypeptidase regulatory-like domain-containing protein n=1 Tax=Corallococcus macrosporus TaxID=35 RepID=A0ABS3DG93_9BACT|nr:carboxypeptidase regulatory-like domain-containing protein [Corallococcus macrosporus]MBN8230343.1 carboxypeptidase regulatory-like domain-containing protein [Corallococcus macrosporus]